MKHTIKKVLIFFVLPVSVGLLLVEGIFSSKVQPGVTTNVPEVVQGVEIEELKETNSTQGIKSSGTVVSAETATISAKLMASVNRIYVSKGSMVKKGDPLIALDPKQVKSYQDQAVAQIQGANAAMSTLEHSIEVAKKDVDKSKLAVQQMQIKLDHMEQTYQRIEKLYHSGATSKQDYENTRTEYLAAKSSWLDAQKNLEQAKANLAVMAAKKGEATAEYQQAQAGFETANVNLQDATIKAPFDGIITEKLVNVGDMATPGTPLLSVEKAPYFLEVDIDERSVGQIKLGDQLPISIDALQFKGKGSVAEITPRIDPASRKFRLKLSLPANLHVTSGMYGQATLLGKGEESIYIPKAAVVSWSQFTGVYVVDQANIAHLTFVNLAASDQDQDQVEVLSGLKIGDRIVVKQVDRVRDRVKVVAQK